MDSRLVTPLLARFSTEEFEAAYRRAVRRAVAVVRMGANAQAIERERGEVRLFQFFLRLAKYRDRFRDREQFLEKIDGLLSQCLVRAWRSLLSSAPRWVIRSWNVGLAHPPHGPPQGPCCRSLPNWGLA